MSIMSDDKGSLLDRVPVPSSRAVRALGVLVAVIAAAVGAIALVVAVIVLGARVSDQGDQVSTLVQHSRAQDQALQEANRRLAEAGQSPVRSRSSPRPRPAGIRWARTGPQTAGPPPGPGRRRLDRSAPPGSRGGPAHLLAHQGPPAGGGDREARRRRGFTGLDGPKEPAIGVEGLPVLEPGSQHLHPWVLVNAPRTITLRDGAVGFVLAFWADWFDENVERLDQPGEHPTGIDDGGYSHRPITGGSAGPSTPPAAAEDLNWRKHAYNTSRSSRSRQADRDRSTRSCVDTRVGGVPVIEWGGDWPSPPGLDGEAGPDALPDQQPRRRRPDRGVRAARWRSGGCAASAGSRCSRSTPASGR
jgi:hypothetical protein